MAYNGRAIECSSGEFLNPAILYSQNISPVTIFIPQKNQAGSLDDCVEDLLEHFVYVPKKSTTNPQDVPVFLSSRLAAPAGDETKKKSQVQEEAIEVIDRMGQPVAHLNQYESHSRDLVVEFETSLVRF